MRPPPRHEGDIDNMASFYVVGGTMPPTALSYVERQADYDLYQCLRQGEFCYVLTSRQMGKSSLMVRTAARLRQEAGMAVASIDLTAVGQNLSPEQWYLGMLRRIGRQLDLEDEIDDYWRQEQGLGPLQRWLGALGDVVLEACPANLILFVDEIDVVRSLPFRADEFFAGIRDCYNRRSSEPVFRRLTFCLLGVATPSHLIDDPHLTPFNIGRRIELRDFSASEAAPLAGGLLSPGLIGPTDRVSAQLLERILYWTDGHPYLTQRFCQAVATSRGTRTVSDVDRICGDIFLGHGAKEQDDNLLFVRESLLRGVTAGSEVASLLRLYAGIRAGKRVEEDSTDSLITALRLSGITKTESGALRVRNQIYRHVFDRDWVAAGMPEAELRRHRAAFLSGVRRTLVLSVLVLTTVLVLTWTTLLQAQRATQREKEQHRLLLWADMKIAEQALELQDTGMAAQVLSANNEETGHSFVRGYLWHQCRTKTLQLSLKRVKPVGRNVSTADHSVRLKGFRVEPRKTRFAFSRDGSLVISRRRYGNAVTVWDTKTGQRRIEHTFENKIVRQSLFRANGSNLVVATKAEPIQVLDLCSATELADSPESHLTDCVPLAYSPDDRWLATKPAAIAPQGNIVIQNLQDPELSFTLYGHKLPVISGAFSADGRLLATGSEDHTVCLWDMSTHKTLQVLKGQNDEIRTAAFAPDGATLATGSLDGVIRFWDISLGREIISLDSGIDGLAAMVFTPDGSELKVAFDDGIIRSWFASPKIDRDPFTAESQEQRQIGE